MSRARNVGARIGTFLLAMLFLFTAVGFSAAVIWQVREEDKKTKQAAAVQEAVEKAKQQATNLTCTTGSADQAAQPPKEGSKLQGTKLQGFTPVDKVEELQCIDLIPGTGDEVKTGDTITAHYTGAVAKDGTIFQSSLDTGKPFTSPLSGLIQGWQLGIPGMKAGGTRRLLIPAAQAYGEQAQEGIPANSDLVFDIQLVSIGQ